MTRQCLGKNRYGNIRIKKTYLYVSGNIPYEQVVLGKRGVELNIEIKKKESEPPYENIPHEQVVLGEQGVEISKLREKESEYLLDNVPHEQVVMGKKQVW